MFGSGRYGPSSQLGCVEGESRRCEVDFPGRSSPAIAIGGGSGDGRAPIQFFVQVDKVSGASPGV